MNPDPEDPNDLQNPQDFPSNEPNNQGYSQLQSDTYPILSPRDPQQFFLPHFPTSSILNQNISAPLNQTGYHGIGLRNPSERTLLSQQIKELEGLLVKGWYYAYSVWLWLLMVASGAMIIFVLTDFFVSTGKDVIFLIRQAFFTVALSIFVLYYCWNEFSINLDKDSKVSIKGFSSSLLFFLCYLLSFIVFYGLSFVLEIELYIEDCVIFLVSTLLTYFLPIWLNVKGVMFSSQMLMEREDSLEQLHNMSVELNVTDQDPERFSD